MKCKSCGQSMPSGSRFCTKCGAPVKKPAGCATAIAVTLIVVAVIAGGVSLMFITGLIKETDGSAVAATATPALTKNEFISLCSPINFDSAARTPEAYNGTNVAVRGQVMQTTDEGRGDMRVALFDADGVPDYGKLIYIKYRAENGAERILENDSVTVYGISRGIKNYVAVLGNEVSMPLVEAYYVDIDKK